MITEHTVIVDHESDQPWSDNPILRPNSRKDQMVFARHETFHPRFGWLKKGFDGASEDGEFFPRENASIRLGVGKNMVKAIKYWCVAFKVLAEIQHKGSRNHRVVPTELGEKLLGKNGWDPFLENPASLWLLHWNLVQAPCLATSWAFTFGIFRRNEFTAEDLVKALADHVLEKNPSATTLESSLRKDVNCLIRMYAQQRFHKGSGEESIDSPFVDMELIRTSIDGKSLYFTVGSKHSLPSEIILAACLEFTYRQKLGSNTVSISRLLYDVGSPGMIFKLTENALYGAIEECASRNKEVVLSDTAGLIQLSFTRDPIKISNEIIEHYYRRRA
jgi:hypothetical protein